MIRSGVFIFLASGSLALGFTPLVREFARRRSARTGKIPRLGGTAIFAAFFLPLTLMVLFSRALSFDRRLLMILAGSLLVLAIGVYDDLRGASVWSRLGVELTAALLVYSVGIRIVALPNPFGPALHLGWLSLPVTLLWIVIITNAINLIDGVDGLAAGSAMLILVAVLLLNRNMGSGVYFMAFFSLLGALLGFLAYNFPPASIYMGDSGSLFLGFILSTFALAASAENSAKRFIGVTALAFSLPLLDMVYAVLRRWYRGVPIHQADQDHLHHKLLRKGLSKRRVIFLSYGANLLLMSVLILLVEANFRPLALCAILFFLSLAAFVAFQFLSDLKPAEFIRKIVQTFRWFRRRRYYSFLINRFERQAEGKKSFAEIRPCLDELFSRYGLQSAEIMQVGEDGKGLVYRFGSRLGSAEVMEIEFPIIGGDLCLGLAALQKKLGSERFLCASELAEILGKFIGPRFMI